jgi:hypothetical protein
MIQPGGVRNHIHHMPSGSQPMPNSQPRVKRLLRLRSARTRSRIAIPIGASGHQPHAEAEGDQQPGPDGNEAGD